MAPGEDAGEESGSGDWRVLRLWVFWEEEEV